MILCKSIKNTSSSCLKIVVYPSSNSSSLYHITSLLSTACFTILPLPSSPSLSSNSLCVFFSYSIYLSQLSTISLQYYLFNYFHVYIFPKCLILYANSSCFLFDFFRNLFSILAVKNT